MSRIFQNKEYLSTDRINTLPFRSHYIPFDVDQDFSFIYGIIDKTKSNKFISLNGEWEFKEHKIFTDLKSIDDKLDTTIDVPSCVQMKGYDYIQYTNYTYPFSYNPPYVPKTNPCFHYRKVVNLKLKDRYYLIFEGVDNAFYVYVNNKFVGYSQISHSKSEFDITEYLLEGDNIIDVVVLKWSKSSYLEDQDKFRFSGIFRDVYLLNRKENHIWDYKIEPIKKDNEWYFDITNLSKTPFKVLFDNGNYEINSQETLSIKVKNVHIWTTKNPYLYDVVIFNEDEKILERVGLRNVYIKDSVFYINDEKIKLKGVNRHESNPKTGATVSIEDTYQDLLLIKSINANAIRTSHYPCIPEFYELCDSLGIFVLSEADVETHGVVVPRGYNLEDWRTFANSGMFDDGVFDREVSLYERDKNRTSIIMWSIGNESSFGKMFYKGCDYIKSKDSRPIHYEGLFNIDRGDEYYTDKVDIISRMYPTKKDIDDYLNDPRETRPLCICEYTHSMGNSCGDARDYWEIINKHDNMLGAFVWEWCDHAVEIDGKLLYGTDFPEHHNDGHFCVDGLVTPYRKFKSNTLEIKAVYGGKTKPDEINGICVEKPKIVAKPMLNVLFCDEYAGISEIYINNKLINLSPIKPCFVRADIDNEMHLFNQLEKVRKANIVVTNKEVLENGISYSATLKSEEDILNFSITYFVSGESLIIDYSYELLGSIIPSRVGLYFATNKIETFDFVGYGPGESYIDKCVHNDYDKHSFRIKDNIGNYLKPQESGSRYGVTELETCLFNIKTTKPYSFNIQNYSIEHIYQTKHDYELVEDPNKTYVNLDVFMNGVGSNSCGPVLEEKYSLPKIGSNTFIIEFKK